MTRFTRTAIVFGAFVTMAVVTAPLAACSYDYMQHTDRVSIRAGNAVS